jgi:hypothetical protein
MYQICDIHFPRVFLLISDLCNMASPPLKILFFCYDTSFYLEGSHVLALPFLCPGVGTLTEFIASSALQGES